MNPKGNKKKITPESKGKVEAPVQKSDFLSFGILSTLSSCIAVIDKSGVIVFVNKAWVEFAIENGTTTLDRVAVGKNYFDALNNSAKSGDKIAEQAIKGIKSVFNNESKIYELQYPCHTTLKKRWLLLRVKLFHEDHSMVVLAHNDITEIEAVRIKFEENENRLRSIYDNEPNCIKIVSPKGEIIDMNKAGLDLLEAESLEVVKSKSILALVHPTYREDYTKLAQNVFKGKSGKLEFEITGLKGTHRWLETIGVPLKDAEGNIVSLLGVTRDITEKRKAIDEIREKEKRFRALVDSAPDATIVADEKGIILIVNKQTVKMFGYSKDELIGNYVEVLIPKDKKTKHKSYRKNYTTNAKVRQMGTGRELIAIKKDGTLIPVEISLAPYHSEEGTLITASIRDITENKKVKKELIDSLQSIRQLTANLQTLREEERTRIARELHDELGQQITCLKFDVAWVQKRINDENNDVKHKLTELQNMLDDAIKSIRRISADLRPRELDEVGFIAALELSLISFENKIGIRTKLILPKEEPNLSDQVKTVLFRIFQESLTNIARHSRAKSVSIKLVLKNNIIVLTIKDNGIGFDENNAPERQTLGVLGMKERVESIGGKFIILGNPGKGTIITVQAPLA